MAPGALLRMVEPGQQLATIRTPPPRRIVLQPQVDTLLLRLQLDACDVPRGRDPQNRLEQFRILQRRSLRKRLYQQDTSTSTRCRAGPPKCGARAGGLTNYPDPL